YLMPKERLIAGYSYFVTQFSDGANQYARLKAFLDNLDRGNFVPIEAASYGSPRLFAKMVLRNPAALRLLAQGLYRLARWQKNLYGAARGVLLTLSRGGIRGRLSYLQFWLFAWSNAVLKYRDLSPSDFDVDSVQGAYAPEHILPTSYTQDVKEDIP